MKGPWRDLISAVLIALFLGSSIGAFRRLWNDPARYDIVEFHEMATNWVAGRSLYFHADAARSSNLNLPHMLPLVLPLAFLDLRHALLLWMGLNTLALLASLEIIRREYPGIGWSPLIVALASAATTAQIGSGQIAWMLVLPVTLAWQSARRNRWHLMAIWMAVCISLKPFLAIFWLYLVLRRRWADLTLCLASTSLITLSGVWMYGPASYVEWFNIIGSFTGHDLRLNASLLGVSARLFLPSDHSRPLIESPLLGHMSFLMCAGAVLSLTTVALISAHQSRGTMRETAQQHGDIDWEFGLLIVTALLISPIGWIYYLWLAAGPLALVGLDRVKASGWAWLGVAALFVPPIDISRLGAIGTVTIGSAYTYGLVMLWWILVRPASRFRATT